ncbi:MAG TPA: hypothetical protein VF145_10505 [Chitinophagaceae bacterium]
MMMRWLLVSTILFAFIARDFDRAFIQLNYYLNTEAYAKNCENKSRPAMKCHGKCQMMKQLKAEEKKDQQQPGQKRAAGTEVLSSKSFFPVSVAPVCLPVITWHSRGADGLAPGAHPEIFHPPATLS